ncbi:hypothetical protein Tsubulata_040741 [Turnera subulata]|uniref:C-JID domain-containing protein n=1 Tax=Turnera subulata TaxID=218843 RepID=A0A9Q0JJR2_9ROSI|nr:hypothetical protein Tsubulata_040741 [Turnera subulata]
MLQDLELSQCRQLKSIPQLPASLASLNVDECSSLERIGSLPLSYFVYWWEYTLSYVPTWLQRLMDYRYPFLSKNGCDKLVEVQQVFKLEPLRETSSKILCDMGLCDLESLESIKVEMFNPWSFTKWETTIQELHEHGIRSIFLPGSRIPGWFSHQSKESKISFHVPQVTGHKSFTMCLCILYGGNDVKHSPASEICVTILNKTKYLVCPYIPTFYAVPNAKEEILWLSHWCLGNRIESGDEVCVTVDWLYSFNIKECGSRLIIEEQEEKDSASGSSEGLVSQGSPHWEQMQVSNPNRWMDHYCSVMANSAMENKYYGQIDASSLKTTLSVPTRYQTP